MIARYEVSLRLMSTEKVKARGIEEEELEETEVKDVL